MKTILLIAAIAVTGCSKKSDSGASGGADDTGCTAAIGKAVDTMIEGRRKMAAERRASAGLPPQDADDAQMAEVSTKLRATLVARCTEDKWPATVVSCFTSASDFNSIKKCEEGLTPEQNRKRQQEVMKVMMGGRLGAGGPHGGAPAMPPTGEPPAAGSGSAAPAAGSGSAAPAAGSGSAAGSAH